MLSDSRDQMGRVWMWTFPLFIEKDAEYVGYENLWVNKNENSLFMGAELVLSVTLNNSALSFFFGAFWEKHLRGEEFDQFVQNTLTA